MKRLALATWRLPHVDLSRLEASREAVAPLADRVDVFTFATCQRTIACTVDEDPRQALDELADRFDLAGAERYTGDEAFAHLARVAASLEALTPGEDQVPAQFRQALAAAEDELVGPLLERLQRVRAVARSARDAGDLRGHRSVSVLELASPLLPDRGPIAVVGTGQIAQAAVDELGDERPVHVVSRDRSRAVDLVEASRAWSRAAFLAGPPPLAGLVLSTRVEGDAIVDDAVADRMAAHRQDPGPLSIVDLGVPRNADPRLGRREDVDLATMADLARLARCQPRRDPRIEEAREALSEALARERRRRRRRRRQALVVSLREALTDRLDALAQELGFDDEEPLRRARQDVTHTSQQHLEAALDGEPPP